MHANPEQFANLLEELEPRTPLLMLDMVTPTPDNLASQLTVTASVFDTLSSDELCNYELAPHDALLLLHRASRLCIDGEPTDDDGVFTAKLYDLVNAWSAKHIPPSKPATCTLADAMQFIVDSALQAGRTHCTVTIDGVHWSVQVAK